MTAARRHCGPAIPGPAAAAADRRRSRPFDPCAGVILLEVILAVAILGISLFSILHAMNTAMGAARSVHDYHVAGRLLENLVNEFQFRLLSPPGEAEEPDPLPVEPFLDGDFGDEYPGFRWERETAPTDADGLYQVRYTVLWTSGQRDRNETVWTYLFDAAEAAEIRATAEAGEGNAEADAAGRESGR